MGLTEMQDFVISMEVVQLFWKPSMKLICVQDLQLNHKPFGSMSIIEKDQKQDALVDIWML